MNSKLNFIRNEFRYEKLFWDQVRILQLKISLNRKLLWQILQTQNKCTYHLPKVISILTEQTDSKNVYLTTTIEFFPSWEQQQFCPQNNCNETVSSGQKLLIGKLF